jgi:hypothetical protein
VPVIGTITAAVVDSLVPWYRRQSVLVAGAIALLLLVYGANLALNEPMRAVMRNVVG